MSTSSATAKRTGRRPTWVYYSVAALLPLAFFALVEFALIAIGYGARYPLFVHATAAGYLQPNEDVVKRYFAHPDDAPPVSIDTTYFRAEKPPGSLRVIVQGGSTAAGFPYGKLASPAGMLQRRLERTVPGREIEVISTALSAVNSYTLLDFADEIIASEPDLVVIYAGHNEFVGILGVASALVSSSSRNLTLLTLKLRRLRLYQLLERSQRGLRHAFAGDRGPRTGTLMARIAGDQRIPFESPLYERAHEQFEANLSDLLAKYRATQIPVLVGTLASNEGDLPPFSSDLAPETDRAIWSSLYERGLEALDDGRLEAATALLERAAAADPVAADAWFALGRARYAAGDFAGAREAYRAARDRDQLRFRAPGSFNEIIRAVSAEHGAVVVDVEMALARESPRGIIGNTLLLEHVHPNVRGYFLLADAYYDAMQSLPLGADWEAPIDDATAWKEQPVTEVERLAGEYRMQRLLADWPFQPEKTPVELPPPAGEIERIAQAWYGGRMEWKDAMNEAMVHYQRVQDIDSAVKVSLNLADAFAFLDNPHYVAGQLLLRQGNAPLALRHLDRAARLAPRKAENLLALSRAYYVNGYLPEAKQTLQALLKMHPRHVLATALLAELEGQDTVEP